VADHVFSNNGCNNRTST